MCGIVGFIGNSCEQNLIDALYKLEYRGYDSAGISVVKNGKIDTIKTSGEIKNLDEMLTTRNSNTAGIAHTRWATHGASNVFNAHPHNSCNNKISIVHNGIIENYIELKQTLIKKGVVFYSETDSEVIPNLIYKSNNKSFVRKFISACNLLKGSYAIACLNSIEKKLYLAKNKSPLYISKLNTGEMMCASDIICFEGKAVDYYTLEDGEFAVVSKNDIRFYNSSFKIIKKQSSKLGKFDFSFDLGNFSHYMEKEICEIPKCIDNLAKIYSSKHLTETLINLNINSFNKIKIIGCGTAYHASCMGEKLLQDVLKVDVSSFVASEFRYSKQLIDNSTLCIFVSQSGETADTLEALKLAIELGASTLVITNTMHSTMAKLAHIVLPTCAGVEKSVASTKAYVCQICVFYILKCWFDSQINKKCFNFYENLENLSILLQNQKYDYLDNFVKLLNDLGELYFIGRDKDFITCNEACLKLKEVTYVNANSYPAGELKHGFLALINQSSYMFVVATEYYLLEKTLNALKEASSRGANIILVTQFKKEVSSMCENVKFIYLPCFDEDLMSIVSIIPFQLLSYKLSVSKNINPDKPRNLAKSVTVE